MDNPFYQVYQEGYHPRFHASEFFAPAVVYDEWWGFPDGHGEKVTTLVDCSTPPNWSDFISVAHKSGLLDD